MKADRLFWILLSVTVALTLNLLITSCTHDAIDFSLLDTVCFERDILGPLQSSCGKSECHGNSNASEGFSVAGYTSIHQFVTPGDPRGSKLFQVITDINSENFMPPDQPLSANQRNLIEVWILQEAKETKCDTSSSDTTLTPPIDWGDSVCFTQDILPIILPSCGTDRQSVGCHSAASQAGGYVLTDYTTIRYSEEIVVPYHADHSKLIEVLSTGEADERMPPSSYDQLSQAQIDLLTTWINDGAWDSDCSDGSCDTLIAITYNNQVSSIFQNNSCVNCHKTPPGNGGILLNSYDNAVAATQVTRTNSSVLIGALRHSTGFSPMPSADYQLSECSIRTIELWIDQGTPE